MLTMSAPRSELPRPPPLVCSHQLPTSPLPCPRQALKSSCRVHSISEPELPVVAPSALTLFLHRPNSLGEACPHHPTSHLYRTDDLFPLEDEVTLNPQPREQCPAHSRYAVNMYSTSKYSTVSTPLTLLDACPPSQHLLLFNLYISDLILTCAQYKTVRKQGRHEKMLTSPLSPRETAVLQCCRINHPAGVTVIVSEL